MASSGKKKTTMAKRDRENRLRERRQMKQAKKDARKMAAQDPNTTTDPWADYIGARGGPPPPDGANEHVVAPDGPPAPEEAIEHVVVPGGSPAPDDVTQPLPDA